MQKLYFGMLMFAFTSTVQVFANDVEDYYSHLAFLCEKKFNNSTGEKVSSEINRVYLYDGGGIVDLVFSRGSMGAFFTRSTNYQSYFVCRVLKGKQPTVHRVKYFYDDVYVSANKSVIEKDVKATEIQEVLMIKSDGIYKYIGQHPYIESKLYQLDKE